MRILLVNPNSTESMTHTMLAAARPVLSPGNELVGVTAGYGPESIEGHYDGVFAVPPLLEALTAEARAVDGVVIGCFDDTGVDAARSLLDVPVIGICQAAMQAATTLAGSFSVITTLQRSVPILEQLARKYGYGGICRRVRASEVPVLELESEGSDAEARIRKELESALLDDGAEAIVLGCAGMAPLAARLSDEYDIPVIEGVTVAVKLVESLATLGLRTSGRGGYAAPRPKRYRGDFRRHAPSDGT